MQDRFHKRKPNLWERSGGEQNEGLRMGPAYRCDAARRIQTSRTDGGNEFGRLDHLSCGRVITLALEVTTSDRAQLESQTQAETTSRGGSRRAFAAFKIQCVHVYAPACNQIWAKVIQGCRGPCLGALLCRDDATSDSACSTRLAAIDVAWTEPEWTRAQR